MHELIGHAPKQPFTQTKMTISPHDDNVGLSAFGLRNQSGPAIVVAAFDAVEVASMP